ncbi:unnamed protein product [Miscanthus lutarioriparius]|uniref:Uncharacterized protein n=1 Tax=Miscanthus lutarioriparius TaxID=422564 RepID=A0A811P7E0_9POAL|nr:unnamed protein product [Miscanthus lutarioriparius]
MKQAHSKEMQQDELHERKCRRICGTRISRKYLGGRLRVRPGKRCVGLVGIHPSIRMGEEAVDDYELHMVCYGGDDDGRVMEWESGLPGADELTPLSQPLVPPGLAAAFRIPPEPGRTLLDVHRASAATVSRLRRAPSSSSSGSGGSGSSFAPFHPQAGAAGHARGDEGGGLVSSHRRRGDQQRQQQQASPAGLDAAAAQAVRGRGGAPGDQERGAQDHHAADERGRADARERGQPPAEVPAVREADAGPLQRRAVPVRPHLRLHAGAAQPGARAAAAAGARPNQHVRYAWRRRCRHGAHGQRRTGVPPLPPPQRKRVPAPAGGVPPRRQITLASSAPQAACIHSLSLVFLICSHDSEERIQATTITSDY